MLETKSNPNSNVTLIGALLIVACLGFVYIYSAPQIMVVKKANLEAASLEKQKSEEVATLQRAQTELTAKEGQLTASGISKQTLAAVLPKTEEMPELYIQMENLMKGATNVKTPTYTLGVPTLTKTSEVQIPVTISGAGKYADLKAFVTTLENNVRPVTFTTLGFAVSTGSGADAKAAAAGEYTLTGTGFVRAQTISPAYKPQEAGGAPTS